VTTDSAAISSASTSTSAAANPIERTALLGWQTDWSGSFVNDWGTRLVVGPGQRREIMFELASMGSYRPLIVCSERFADTEYLASILAPAEPGAVAVFSGMSKGGHKPTDVDIDRVAEAARKHGADGLVAIGGGFILDLAKVSLAALSPDLEGQDWRSRDDVKSFLKGPGQHERAHLFRRVLPLVVVPTTAGPGTETSSRSAVRNAETNARIVVAGPQYIPRVAVLDPELTVSLDYLNTVGTGTNAFAHCVEALYATSRNPLAQRVAVSAAQLIFDHLPRAVQQPDDLAARAAMQVASALSGMALTNAYVGVHHSLCHPLGLELGVTHGTANFIMLRHVLRYNLEAAADVLAVLGCALGVTPLSKPSAEDTVDAIEAWQDRFSVPRRLRDTGKVSPSDFPMLAQHAFEDGPTRYNPRHVTSAGELEDIYRRAW
jgi:4-hydroxybutyrate dehydrogenase